MNGLLLCDIGAAGAWLDFFIVDDGYDDSISHEADEGEPGDGDK